jgi:DNA-binding protein HU-beta
LFGTRRAAPVLGNRATAKNHSTYPCKRVPKKNACVAGCAFINEQRKGTHVNKSELIDAIAKSADISKAAAGRALDATVASIKTSLRKGSMVTLVGFGTFYVGKRAARSGRNPRTGASIKIRAAKVPKFRAGKALKDALN